MQKILLIGAFGRHKLFAYGARARQKLSESGCKL